MSAEPKLYAFERVLRSMTLPEAEAAVDRHAAAFPDSDNQNLIDWLEWRRGVEA